jgi:hypothetical protein
MRDLGDVAMITAESTMLLKGLKEDDFQGCFSQWEQMWDKCIASEGDKNDVPDNMYAKYRFYELSPLTF